MKEISTQIDQAMDALRFELDGLAGDQNAGRRFLIRSLSLQRQLAPGECRRFLAMAACFELLGACELRNLLYRWAVETELHDDVANFELRALDAPQEGSLDAELWGAYFDSLVLQRPYMTLGATYALACLQAEADRAGRRLACEAALPHENFRAPSRVGDAAASVRGSQIVNALQSSAPDEEDFLEVVAGARAGGILGLRMARWAMGRSDVTAAAAMPAVALANLF